jgi:catechol 2,3-dioxygenase-like lactoylglutathione lyase family enzyme
MVTGARRIDHLVLAVRDLDAAADLYERVGSLVGARNRHPWVVGIDVKSMAGRLAAGGNGFEQTPRGLIVPPEGAHGARVSFDAVTT